MFFLGALADFMLKDPATKVDTRNLLLGWADSNSKWLWKSAMFTYARLHVEEDYGDLKASLQNKLEEQLNSFRENELFLLAEILSCASHVRTMVCETLSKLFNAADEGSKGRVADLYLSLVSYCYYIVDEGTPELFLVVCEVREQQRLLSPLLRSILSVRARRKWLFAVLGPYLKEVSHYSVSDRTAKHIAAYFGNLMQSAPIYRGDVVAFLKGCSCNMSKCILKLLHYE